MRSEGNFNQKSGGTKTQKDISKPLKYRLPDVGDEEKI
jgi:hypothetical protein